jgi:RNase P subunit RPR2
MGEVNPTRDEIYWQWVRCNVCKTIFDCKFVHIRIGEERGPSIDWFCPKCGGFHCTRFSFAYAWREIPIIEEEI